jgi:hypothetical protein
MAACRYHTTLRSCTCRAVFPYVQERNEVYSKGYTEEPNLETVKLIRTQQLIRKQEDIADVCDTVFTIHWYNQNTPYGESSWARFSCCVPTTGVFYKSWYLLVLATKWQPFTGTMLATCPSLTDSWYMWEVRVLVIAVRCCILKSRLKAYIFSSVRQCFENRQVSGVGT